MAMEESAVLDYVKASAAMMGLPMDAARASRVAEHLQRTAALARLLEQAGLDVSDELAEIYRLERPPVNASVTPPDGPSDSASDRDH